jgi:nucleoside-diphosphate-sugar epimerase
MHALVTGGSGFLGRYITEQLLARGDRVRVFSRRPSDELEALGAEVRPGNMRDCTALDRACVGVDTVFHTAAIAGVWGPGSNYALTNTYGTQLLLAAARRHGVSRFVFTSTPSVVFDGRDHDPGDESLPYARRYLCHYPATKAAAEKAVIAANTPGGLLTVSLRPHLIWGPRDPHLLPRLIDRSRRGQLRIVGNGTNRVSVSYVENVAAAHLRAADRLEPGAAHAGRSYFINEPEPVVLWPWINDLLSRVGLPPVTRRVSPSLAYAAGAMLEAAYTAFGKRSEPRMTRFLALQLSRSHVYSIAAAERDFGYNPPTTMDEAMRRTEPWLKELAARPLNTAAAIS